MQLAILEPKNANAHICLGDAYYELERYEEAIEAYKQGIRLNPNDPSGCFNLAKTYLKMDNRDLALKEYEILKTLDGKLAKELANLIPKKGKKLKLIGSFLSRKPVEREAQEAKA
jgi:tetratricopeptide (TPR) repeat protein